MFAERRTPTLHMSDEEFDVVIAMRTCGGSRERLGKTLAQSPNSAYADAPLGRGYSPAIRLPARSRARLSVEVLYMIGRASAKLMVVSIRCGKAIEAALLRKTISFGLLDSRTA